MSNHLTKELILHLEYRIFCYGVPSPKLKVPKRFLQQTDCLVRNAKRKRAIQSSIGTIDQAPTHILRESLTEEKFRAPYFLGMPLPREPRKGKIKAIPDCSHALHRNCLRQDILLDSKLSRNQRQCFKSFKGSGML